MRYVPTLCLKEGMKIGKNIYSSDGIVLLAKDVILKNEYIESLEKLGIGGAYIEDNLSRDIQINSIISEELKIQAVKAIKEIYNNPKSLNRAVDTVDILAKNIMWEILKNKNIMVNMIDIRSFDDYMYNHSVNVAVLSAVIGLALNLETSKIEKLTASALLHDIGKVFIPKEILNKNKNITKEDKKLIESHCEKGYRYIKNHYNIPVTTYIGILQHHERFDGKGYPDGKKGEEISKFGRIIAICDTYDKIITERPNKKAVLPSEAMEYIMANNGQMFDPKLVKLFLRRVAAYPLGTILKLSNGERVIVIENNEECCIRPKVRNVETEEIYDLTYDWNLRNITIVEVEKG